jgi:uncharacterized protein (TIGR04222 family)
VKRTLSPVTMGAFQTGQMTDRQRELWERISQYEFDDPASEYPFTERLATENGWSLGYALRVVGEYRRFAFLAVVAGHPVSPSDPVDQAWHLHQLYSDSYWDDFNAEVLGKTLSHQPTKGGEEEADKFAQWYDKTRDSYRRFFGLQPPADIWPSGDTDESAKPYFTRVNHAENWVVGKGRVRAAALFVLVWAGTSAGLFATGSALGGGSPLNFKGPDFLSFYIISLLGAVGVLVYLVLLARKMDGEVPSPESLDAYELACLNGGPRLAVFAAIAKLFNEGKLRKNAGTDTFSGDTAYAPPTHPLELRIFEYAVRLGGGCSPSSLCQATQIQTAALVNELEDRGLWFTEAQFQRLRGIVAGVICGLASLGCAKLFIGLTRGKPVFFLLVLTAATLIAGLYYCKKMHRRTSIGNSALALSKERCERAVGHAALNDSAAVALVVGGLGLAALPMVGMSDLRRTLVPPPQVGGDGSSGCSTSTCGSSCGGGGGCGGGGCGGCGGS